MNYLEKCHLPHFNHLLIHVDLSQNETCKFMSYILIILLNIR